jgi:hypothetical protein
MKIRKLFSTLRRGINPNLPLFRAISNQYFNFAQSYLCGCDDRKPNKKLHN